MFFRLPYRLHGSLCGGAAPLLLPLLALFPVAPVYAQELPGGGRASLLGEGGGEIETDAPAAPVMVRKGRKATPPRPVARIPVMLPRLSSRFGYRVHPIQGRRTLHAGIDIPGRYGTPVMASDSGMVRFAGRAGGYGLMVELDHGNGIATRYAHLSRLVVSSGMAVARGDMVGQIGSTGRSTGNHLHFEVRLHGQAVDPMRFLGTASAGPTGGSSYVFAGDDMPREAHISAFARSRMEAGQADGTGL